jgi:hypothetical protein
MRYRKRRALNRAIRYTLWADKMEYRGVEFTVVQVLRRNGWRWYATVNGVCLSGEAETQFAAVAEVREVIDQALWRWPTGH